MSRDANEVKILKQKRGAYKCTVTYFDNRISECNSVGEIQSALGRLRASYSKYEEVQIELELEDEKEAADRIQFEEDYGKVESTLLDKLEVIKQRDHDQSLEKSLSEKLSTVEGSSKQYLNRSNENPGKLIKFKLPEVPLIKFDGDKLKWLSFRDVFVSVIHSNDHLSNIEKFYYLIGSVKEGLAFRLIDSIPITDDNYKTAWEKLFNHYNNEFAIQQPHVRRIYEIKRPQENSHLSLNLFVDTIETNLQALGALKVDYANWSLLLNHHIMERLDSSSKIEILKKLPLDRLTDTKELLNLLKSRVRILEHLSSYKFNEQPRSSNFEYSKINGKPSRVMSSTVVSCIYCNSADHNLKKCCKFSGANVTPFARFEFVKSNNLCTNCLSVGHKVLECQSSHCLKCGMKHHTLLHFSKSFNQQKPVQCATLAIPKSSSSDTSLSVVSTNGDNIENYPVDNDLSVLPPTNVANILSVIENTEENELPETMLATICLWVQSDKGYRIPCRALLDSGSQRNFITERMCQLLEASKQSISHPISGFSGHISYVKWSTSLNIHSRSTECSQNLRFLVVKKICGNLPNNDINLNKINCNLNTLPKHVILADPNFYKSSRIDMLIGVELFNHILLSETYVMNSQLPTFRNSLFGYLIFGRLHYSDDSHSQADRLQCLLEKTASEDQLLSLIQRFWKLEHVSSNAKSQWSTNEKLCEDHFVKNTIRLNTGRYSVSLPVKSNIGCLGQSELSALHQFNSLEKRLNRNDHVKQQYDNFMREYYTLGHMEEVLQPTSNGNQYDKIYFLPHHAVFKDSSTTTKLRVVFNASSPTSSELSLNDGLLSGPTIQQDLFSIVIRFRSYLYGLSADITKMYRQILNCRGRNLVPTGLHENQRDLHRIWWRYDKNEKIRCYRLKTVTYGTTCASFLAIRTLFKLADDEHKKFTRASEIVKRDFYVDDVLTGSDTIQTTEAIKSELIQLLNSGGFELHKWASNCLSLSDNCEDTSGIISVLGLSWDISSDCFRIQINISSAETANTKRRILSEIAQLYDPIGLIAPVIVVAKHLMQTLFANPKLDWDDILESKFIEHWQSFKSQLSLLNVIEIPRCIKTSISRIFELHAFGDASEKANGTTLYVRTVDAQNKFIVRLLCSKSKIAPLKTQTIPRLELCAALLTAELASKVMSTINITFSGMYYWTDSEITWWRIKTSLESTQTKLPIFEANRVANIQELSSPCDWHYVPTSINPADIVSRGLMPAELLECQVWWNGPHFLSLNESLWPDGPNVDARSKIDSNNLIAECCQNIQSAPKFELLNQYSSLFKLLRVSAYLIRFASNCRLLKGSRISGELKISEINHALKIVIKLSQISEFHDELQNLSKNKFVSPKSKLKLLCPFLDTDGIIRVGGRLRNSYYNNDKKHPIVLIASCTLAKLLVESEHIKLLHAGPQQLLYSIRQRFWILNGRNLCRKIVHKCLKCFRVKPRSVEQFMGQLPAARIQPSKPFTHVGIDFCGPFHIKYKFRTKVTTKAYVCVFVCFVTRAVHLEVVSDLSTQSFIASLRRFCARRGRCSYAYSDNGTNFVGAKGELLELQKFLKSEHCKNEVLSYCIENGIQWQNIPPRSPHFGGLWEAAVKVAKTHMKRVVGDTTFILEDLITLITEIEACMNSRPLTPMSNDPSDLEVLSPAHFLIGAPLTSLPSPDLTHLNYNRLTHYQQIQYLLQKFWKRWQHEVLSELQERQKWYKEPIMLKVGALILIKEQNIPPLKWITGRIMELLPGKDGIVRKVVVKTSSSTFVRTVANICILPINDHSIECLDNVHTLTD